MRLRQGGWEHTDGTRECPLQSVTTQFPTDSDRKPPGHGLQRDDRGHACPPRPHPGVRMLERKPRTVAEAALLFPQLLVAAQVALRFCSRWQIAGHLRHGLLCGDARRGGRVAGWCSSGPTLPAPAAPQATGTLLRPSHPAMPCSGLPTVLAVWPGLQPKAQRAGPRSVSTPFSPQNRPELRQPTGARQGAHTAAVLGGGHRTVNAFTIPVRPGTALRT